MLAAFGSDDWLDARLRDVPLPEGLLARLRAVVPSDEQVDEALGDVPLPPDLLAEITQIPVRHRRRRAPQSRRFAVAASIALAVGASYVVLGWELVVGLRPVAQVAPPADRGADPNGGNQDRDSQDPDGGPPVPLVPDALATAADLELDAAGDAALDELFNHSPPSESSGAASLVHGEPAPAPPVPSLAPRVQRVFAASASADVTPQLEALPLVDWRGFVPPRVSGYDLLFHLKHADHPLASPAAHPSLATIAPPLSTSTASYRDAWRQVQAGRLPPPESVRTADFLAAVPYDYPPPPFGLGMRTAAGPNPLGSAKSRLLQIAVQAAPATAHRRQLARLVVVVDASAALARAGRMGLVQDALVALAQNLAPGERLSIVACGDAAQILVDDADAASAEAIAAAIDSLEPTGRANPGAALELAAQQTLKSTDNASFVRRIVLVGDGRSGVAPEVAESVEQLVKKIYAAGAVLDVCDVARDGAPDEWLSRLAAAGGGEHRDAADAAQLRRALLESLVGERQIVAEHVRLRVNFNPAVVHKYRLIGHESATVTGQSASAEIDLAAGDTATALFEVWLNSAGGDDVATAKLTWQDPRTLGQHSAGQRISRLQFAKSLREAPLPLFAAAIAAGTAESLRGSYYASPKSLERVIGLAGQLPPKLKQEPSLTRMLDLARAAARLQPAAAAGR